MTELCEKRTEAKTPPKAQSQKQKSQLASYLLDAHTAMATESTKS